MMRHVWKTVLPAMIISFGTSAALADETITRIETTALPSYGNSSETTVRTVTTPDLTPVKEMIVSPAPTVIHTETSTVEESNGLGRPTYIKRAALLREQLNNGVAKGWINSTDAEIFNNRLNILESMAQSNVVDCSKPEATSLEGQLNQFNIDLTRKLSNAPAGNSM
jgi:hypothetical protein